MKKSPLIANFAGSKIGIELTKEEILKVSGADGGLLGETTLENEWCSTPTALVLDDTNSSID